MTEGVGEDPGSTAGRQPAFAAGRQVQTSTCEAKAILISILRCGIECAGISFNAVSDKTASLVATFGD